MEVFPSIGTIMDIAQMQRIAQEWITFSELSDSLLHSGGVSAWVWSEGDKAAWERSVQTLGDQGLSHLVAGQFLDALEMVLKVYGKVLLVPTALVLAALHEKEVTDYELVDVDMMARAHKMPDYLAMQEGMLSKLENHVPILASPFGQVPVFVDGPLTLFESRAIARFIAHKFEGQGTSLCGSTPIDHALVEQWLEVEGQNFFLAVRGILSEKNGKLFTGKQPNEAVVLAHIEKLGRILDVYEVRLKNNKYLAGDFFSLADLAHVPSLHHLVSIVKLGDKVLEGRPHVKSWWEDISTRPAWKKLSPVIQQELAQFQASRKVPFIPSVNENKWG